MQLYKGDCLEVMGGIPDGSVDMILCDLPYGKTRCKWDSVIQFDELWKQYERIAKRNCAIVLFGNEPFSSSLRTSNIKRYKYDWTWDKKAPCGHLNSHSRPMKKVENIMVFSYGKACYYPQGLVRNPRTKTRNAKAIGSECYGKHGDVSIAEWQGYPTDLLCFLKENGLHPTQKPVPLLEYLIKTYTLDGETVLDNCMGSGSTGVACVNTGRDFIGIERDEKYFEIAQERIKAAQEKAEQAIG